MVTRLTLPDVARKYGRPLATVRQWRYSYDWPEPRGTRGKWQEFDEDAVDQAVRAILALPDAGDGADPGELLGMKRAAAEAGISYGTLRSYVSRSPGRYWPLPDDEKDGVKRWKRSTVRAYMAARRPRASRRAPEGEAVPGS